MAKRRVTLKDVKHVDLEPQEFITEIAMNPEWNLEDIGAYVLLCIYLYNTGGKLVFDTDVLSKLCKTNSQNFENIWKRIEKKFVKTCLANTTEISHKRVLTELRAARERIQKASNAGLIGAKVRWQSQCDRNGNGNAIASTKRNETKRNKIKQNETKQGAAPQQIRQIISSHSDSLRFAQTLENIIPPFSRNDKTAYVNLIHWTDKQKEFDPDIQNKIINLAKNAKNGNPRNKIAVFFAALKRELDYG